MTVVFMFPGQSSRYPGMIDKLVALRPENRVLVQQASDLLDWDLEQHFCESTSPAFQRNVDVQVGVFLATHLYLVSLEAAGVRADYSLGLSLGEYNHLVHIGALDFDDALLAVRARGEAYDAGPRGMMVSVQPIDVETLQLVVDRASEHGVVEISNLNSPMQQVISGEEAAVQEAVRILEDEQFAQTVVIERQVPMHSSLFRNVGLVFRRYLNNLPFARPSLPYLPNRLGEFIDRPAPARFVELLTEHVYAPVLWRRSIERVLARDPDAIFVEVGPLSVLYNLLSRKWCRNRKFRTDGAEPLDVQLRELVTGLGAIRSAPTPVHEAECTAS